jgi:cell division protein FtsB
LRLRQRLRRQTAVAEVTVKRKPAFTSRAAVLAVVVAALAIALAAPVRQLLSQRAQIASLRNNVAAQKQRVADLEKQQALWADPAYVAAQAADRLHYVRPGQIPFVTLSPKPAAAASASAAAALANQPWYGQLWSSVQVAGMPSRSSPTLRPAPTSSPAPAATVSPTPSSSARHGTGP